MAKGLTDRQQNDIHRLMRSIKDARDEGKDERVVKERTRELYNYLEDEGIILPPEYQ